MKGQVINARLSSTATAYFAAEKKRRAIDCKTERKAYEGKTKELSIKDTLDAILEDCKDLEALTGLDLQSLWKKIALNKELLAKFI